MSGRLVVGLNPHGEVTSLLFPGRVVMQKQTLLSCIRNAFAKAKTIAEAVQQSVEDDLSQRKDTFVKPRGYETKNLRSDSGYNRWLIEQRINRKKLKMEEGGVPMEEDLQESPDAAQNEMSDSEDTIQRPVNSAETPPDNSLPMEMGIKTENGSEQNGKLTVETEEEEEEVKTRLTASDLF